MPTDLKAFQTRLNSDKAFRSRFFKEPVKTLEAEGLILPAAAKKHLVGLVAELTAKKRPAAGSSLDEGGSFKISLNLGH